MKNFIQTLTVLMAILSPSLAVAQSLPAPTGTKLVVGTAEGQLAGVALNDATPANRTVSVNVARRYAKLRLGIAFTRSAATTVDAQFTCSYTSGGTQYLRTTKACSSGICTLYEQTLSNPQTTSLNFEIEFDVRGCHDVEILLSGTSAGAGDLVTTQSVLIVGD